MATSTFGTVAKLPSGNWRAQYYGPGGRATGRRYGAPTTFRTKADARKFLATVHAEIITGKWMPPSGAMTETASALTLAQYAETWLAHRDIRPRTAAQYRSLLDRAILPKLGSLPVNTVTGDDIRGWYAKLDKSTPTWRAQAYGLLRTILGDAVRDGKLAAQPCNIRGAGSVKRARNIKPATLAELTKLTDAMPEQYRAMVTLAAWCALRFGELTELRRRDVDPERGVIHVRRAVSHVEGKFIIGEPKTAAGSRDVNIPPNVLADVRTHLVDHVEADANALLFPGVNGQHLNQSTFTRWFYPARDAIRRGADDPYPLHFHALRHTGAVMAAQAGATLAELMGRLGHTTPQAAMIYQHASAERDRALAERIAAMAEGGGFA
ncbi:MAG TPA: site-specific integrase [Candidatus Baltobacteraceae bacterium]|nr:site-specific integrase [Candidatus Baltobacteraceae bacterium]